MTAYTVEHRRYKPGGDDVDETSFGTEAYAKEYARQCLSWYGGRVWINNVEKELRDL